MALLRWNTTPVNAAREFRLSPAVFHDHHRPDVGEVDHAAEAVLDACAIRVVLQRVASACPCGGPAASVPSAKTNSRTARAPSQRQPCTPKIATTREQPAARSASASQAPSHTHSGPAPACSAALVPLTPAASVCGAHGVRGRQHRLSSWVAVALSRQETGLLE